MQEILVSFVQYHAKWNKKILDKKNKNNTDTSNFPILSDSFFVGLRSYFIKAPYGTNTNKAKVATTLRKNVQPKCPKIPITSSAQGK